MANAPVIAKTNQPANDAVANNKQQPFFKPFIQPKLSVNQLNDVYEQEADAMADHVMRMPDNSESNNLFFTPTISSVQRKCEHCEEEERKMQRKESNSAIPDVSSQTENYINSLSGGSTLSENERSFFEPRMGYDFSNVKIHTGAEAAKSARSINALAYTIGDNIVFNHAQYSTDTDKGKRLMSHELTHVIQQKQITGKYRQSMIQRTEVGSILDEFFSPFSTQRLWVMDEADDYTQIVRNWQPVMDAMDSIKKDIAKDRVGWSVHHRTTPGWMPAQTAIPDPNAYRKLVTHPPGTDPGTCARAFEIYQGSRGLRISSSIATGGKSVIPVIQTNNLYTCSIGSFTLAVTINVTDFINRSADINIWMFNVMSQHSFGLFSNLFPISGQQNQFMWWNWNETIHWKDNGDVTTDTE
jgi:hypothetical protein